MSQFEYIVVESERCFTYQEAIWLEVAHQLKRIADALEKGIVVQR